jgi:hypothetical protein
MTCKRRHVLRVLANLATVLLLVRYRTGASWMGTFLCSGHTIPPQNGLYRDAAGWGTGFLRA